MTTPSPTNTQTLAIAATFTADPLKESLRFWMEKLGMSGQVEFAPYNQVFQQLLDPSSILSRNSSGVNVILFRFDDLRRFIPEDKTSIALGNTFGPVEEHANELIDALKSAVQRSGAPYLLFLLPSAPQSISDSEWSAFIIHLEQHLTTELAGVSGLYLVTGDDIFSLYPSEDYYDPYGDAVGHVPYTPTFFTALGTMIFRRLYVLQSPPRKVIVLDCDQTLWRGICGEDGPMGVAIDPPHAALQNFMISQVEKGMLLCLCSKNEETDVWEVFKHHPEMPLKRDHCVSWKINWRPKSENVKALANDLKLGLDSFVLVDDSPVECAEVQANCPGILALQLPSNPDLIPAILRHVWAFDHLRVTEEDRQRTHLYQQNMRRQRFEAEASTFEDFLAGLHLEIDIDALSPDQFPRVAQLTQRTNQFNLTTIRRTEKEISSLMTDVHHEVLTVKVRDRFGDYGLVGVVIYRLLQDALEVDTFLLSCRVLGKGVEHRMLSRLGEIALSRDLSHVRLIFHRTRKNVPALDFLVGVGVDYQYPTEEGFIFNLPANHAAALVFRPGEPTINPPNNVTQPNNGPNSLAIASAPQPAQVPVLQIATELSDPKNVLKFIESQRTKRSVRDGVFVAPVTALERKLVAVWQSVLHIEDIGVTDGFFALGGESLKATQIISRIRRDFGVELSLDVLFEHATVRGIASKIDEVLSSAKLSSEHAVCSIPRPEKLPVSFAQERLLFLDQLHPNSPLYNLAYAARINGRVNVDTLQQALTAIAKRHEALRTTFSSVDGELVQNIANSGTFDLPTADLRGLPVSERKAAARRLAREEAVKPFDLSKDLALRARLIRLGGEESVLVLVMHHIASDGWSVGLALRELDEFYDAFSKKRSVALAELRLQYADYAVWQRKELQGERLEKQVDYWKKQLAGMPLLLDLPADRPRPIVQTYQGEMIIGQVPWKLKDRLKRFSENEGCSLYMTLLAAFQVMLYRYVGRDQIIVGTPVAGRNVLEVEGLVGCFINTLVLRGDCAGNPIFKEFLRHTKDETLAAYAHSELPFEKLVDGLPVDRNMNHNPVVQVLFVQEKPLRESLRPGGLFADCEEIHTGTSKFDLTLFFGEQPDGLTLAAEYSTDLFDASTIRRFLLHYQTLLEAIVSEPDKRLSELSLLPESERHQLLVDCNKTQVDYPRNVLLHELFEAQVERTPEAVAVQFEEECFSYSELNERANQLAHYLRTLSVGPDTFVGVCMERSLDLVVALYGILKAGGAYVPIDPEYPRERIEFMLQDAAVPVLLTHRRLADQLPCMSSRIVCLEEEWESIACGSVANPDRTTTPDDLAYMIYTSGSTGKPKGAMNTHRGICNRLLWMQGEYGLRQPDRVLQKTPFSFDVSVWEFFWPLLVGARLIVAKPGGHRDPEYLVSTIRQHGVTVLHFVPSMLRMFLDEPGVEACNSLRHVICSGEALSYELQERFFEVFSVQLHNLYGPTEAAVDVTHWTCQPHSEKKVVPIGKPVANTQIYILDQNLQPLPIGVPGELYIGGIQVGRGYHNRPELTAERFIPDPFRPRSGARIYKTGDLCRWLADGNIEYLGRTDFQVKIRGLRVELGEIEAEINAHPLVKTSLVACQEGRGSEKQLVAYVIWKTENSSSVEELQNHLKKRLPDYMVPSAFVSLAQFPMTPNGKVDRKALPQVETMDRGDGFVAPQSEMEQQIAEIWQKVLGVSRVGRDSNFFDLGGDSLRLMIVRRRLQEAMNREVAMVDLFRWTTVHALAHHLTGDGESMDTLQNDLDEIANRKDATRRLLLRRRLIEQEGKSF